MIVNVILIVLLSIFAISTFVVSCWITMTISDSFQARRYNKEKELKSKGMIRLESIVEESQDIEELLRAISAKNIIKTAIRRKYT